MPVIIKAKTARGFYRCGVHHTPQEVTHADGRFTAEQLEILRAEPMLEVHVVGKKPQGDGSKKSKEEPSVRDVMLEVQEEDEKPKGGKGKKSEEVPSSPEAQ